MNTNDMVDMIHTKLAIRYGSRWLQLYDGIEPALFPLIKADWCEVLSGVSLKTALYALQNLPRTYPPIATEFAALCQRAPVPQAVCLPRPTMTPAKHDEIRQMLTGLTHRLASKSSRPKHHRE